MFNNIPRLFWIFNFLIDVEFMLFLKKKSKLISFCIKSLLAKVIFLLPGNNIIALIPDDNWNNFSPFLDMHSDFLKIEIKCVTCPTWFTQISGTHWSHSYQPWPGQINGAQWRTLAFGWFFKFLHTRIGLIPSILARFLAVKSKDRFPLGSRLED